MEYGVEHAELYDAVFRSRGKDYPREADDVVDLVVDRSPGAATLLDVACGTGLHLQTFAKSFEQVEGVELSPSMAAIAREQLPGVPITEGDMRTFALGRGFDVVTCLSKAVAEVGALDGLRRAIRTMSDHLVAGGVLVVEPWFFADDYLEGYVGGHLFRDEGRVVSRVTHSTRDGQTARHTITFTVADAEAGTRTFSEVLVFGLFTRDDYVDAMRAAGVTAELVPRSGHVDGRQDSPGLFVGVKR